jgi:tRNA-dihydrouridine synthase B
VKIGPLRIAHPVILAAMEEHTHYYFRRLMKRFGASLVRSERVDARQAAKRDRRAMRLLFTAPDESPHAGQISGADPAVMAEAARVVEQQGFRLVDLNFECPVRRLIDRGEGGALLADPPAIGRIVEATVRAVSIPVTIKIRSGPDAQRETAVEVARRAQDAGVAGVEVHARSVAQAYQGGPDWTVIRRVKQAVAIPVAGSGGVRTAADARQLLRETGADAVAIARGCLGNPWIFRETRALILGAARTSPPTPAQRGRVLLELVEAEFQWFGAPLALRRLGRTSCYFAKFVPQFDEFREAVKSVRNLPQFRRLVKEHFG